MIFIDIYLYVSGDVIFGYLFVNYCFLMNIFLLEWFFVILIDYKNFCYSFRLVLGELFILSCEGKEMWIWLIKELFYKV